MAKRSLEVHATRLELAAKAAAERMRNSRREPLFSWESLLGPEGLAGVGKTMRMTRAQGGMGVGTGREFDRNDAALTKRRSSGNVGDWVFGL